MRACCALVIAALLSLPAYAADGDAALSGPASAVAPGPALPASAAAPALPIPAAPTPAAAPIPETAASAPAAEETLPASAPRRAHVPGRTHAPGRAHTGGRKRRTEAGTARAAAAEMAQRNPVIEAINLVATTQRAEILAADRKVANADWWVDALEREWIVKRPFGPGLFDTTHWFYVSYKVNGRVLMSWFVDLSKGTVSPTTPPDRPENGK